MDILKQSDFTGELDFLGGSSRRVFVKGLGTAGLSLLLSSALGGCEKIAEAIKNRPVRRRIRAGSAAVDADMQTYKDAVGLMKGLAAADQRNWLAEATIHGTAGAFNQCEHGTNHFFDWHRGYLFYFEKICQKLTGKPKFGLPYWNWNQNPGVPAQFLDNTSTLFSARTRTTMAGNVATTTPTLDIIFSDTNFFTFSNQLEGTPHNTVHTWIGGTLAQGNSPLDPLFWCHHNMIDYCWYKWNVEMGRQNSNDPAWTGTNNGQFIDGDGNAATSAAGVSILMPLLSYRFESSAVGSNPAQLEIKSAKEFKKVEERLRAGAPIRFVVSQRARIAERADMAEGRPAMIRSTLRAESFAGILESSTERERVFLAVAQADVPTPADFYVRVFVNLPEANAETPTEDPHFAGSFAFFGNPADRHHAGPADRPRFLVDLTHTLKTLRERGGLAAGTPFTVQLVPTPIEPQRGLTGLQMVLSGLDVITTPVIVTEPAQER